MHYSIGNHNAFPQTISRYCRFVRGLFTRDSARDWRFSAVTLAAFLLEPTHSLQAGLTHLFGLETPF